MVRMDRPVEWYGRDVDAIEWGNVCCSDDDPTSSLGPIEWAGYDCDKIEWSGECCSEGVETMIQWRWPVRRKNYQRMTYTFRSAVTGTAIDLSSYVMVKLCWRKANGTSAELAAVFLGSKTTGKVKIDKIQFTTVGKYDVQFIVYDASNTPFYGDPLQFDVVQNLDDMTIDDGNIEW